MRQFLRAVLGDPIKRALRCADHGGERHTVAANAVTRRQEPRIDGWPAVARGIEDVARARLQGHRNVRLEHAQTAAAAAPLLDLGSRQGVADHKSFTVATNVQVYFCDPHSPWQRGSNENTNGLLRQYFPRGTDLARFSQDYLNRIAQRLNQRPRKTLGFETPADRLRAVLQ